MPQPLSLVADLSLESDDGQRIRVQADGSVLVVRLPNLWLARRHAGLLRDRQRRAWLLHQLHRGLGISDLSIEIYVRRRRIARLAPESQPNGLKRWLGLGEVEVYPLGVLRALWN